MTESTEIGFWRWATSDGDRIAIVEPDARSVTYAELLADSNRVAHGLRSLGLATGDSIAYLLGNQIEVYSLVLAASQIGLYYTPINHHLVGDEVAYILGDCGAGAFIVAEQFAEVGRAAAAAAGIAPEHCFAVGTVPGFRPFAELVANQPDTLPEERTAGNPMVYTSGTTGRPKGVAPTLTGLSPEDDAARRAIIATQIDIPVGDGVHLVQGPLYHSAPLGFSTTALHIGNTLVLMDKWSAEAMLELCGRYQVTNTQMVPTMFHRLLALPDHVRRTRRRRRDSFRAPLGGAVPGRGEATHDRVVGADPVRVLRRYRRRRDHGRLAALVGAARNRRATVARHDAQHPRRRRERVPDRRSRNHLSEDAVRRARVPQRSREDRRRVRHGELFTLGDVGYLDEDGWLFLCDRKIDMIISGGVNIYPAEIEAVLLEHPKVGDAAVIGVPNTEWGEEVKAVVEPAVGVTGDPELEAELIEFCRERLAKFKCPRTVDFRRAPALHVGKALQAGRARDVLEGRRPRDLSALDHRTGVTKPSYATVC